MAKDNIEKEIARAADGVKTVKTSVYLVGKRQAAAVLIAGAVMLAALICYTFVNVGIVRIISLVAIGVCAAFVIGLYAAIRAKGPVTYTAAYCRAADGTETVIQRLSKTKFVFACGKKVIECDRGYVTGGKLFREDLRWDWFRCLGCEEVKSLNSRDKKYRLPGGSLCLRDGKAYYAETGKARIRYSEINDARDAIAVPDVFYRAIKRVCPDESLLAFVRPDGKA